MLYCLHPVQRVLQSQDNGLGIIAVLEIGRLQFPLCTPDPPQLSPEGHWFVDLLRQQGLDAPVLDRHKGFDLSLTVHDQTQGRGLHPPGGETFNTADPSPEQRADAVSDQPVEDAPRLLSLDQGLAERPRLLKRGLDRAAGDFVKGHAVDGNAFWQRPTQYLEHVPGDRLTLTIQVCSQIEGLHVLGSILELLNGLLFPGCSHVLRSEPVLDVDPHRLSRQVANVSHRRSNRVVSPQNAADRPGFGRRFDDNQCPAQGPLLKLPGWRPLAEPHGLCSHPVTAAHQEPRDSLRELSALSIA